MELTELTPESVAEAFDIYRTKPVEYIRDVYGVKLWWLQEEIVNSVFKYSQTAVKSCNSVGKSFIAACVAHAYLDLHPGSIVVTTAPTFRQVKDVLWRYIATRHKTARYNLGGHLTQTGLEYDTDWYAIGFSTNAPDNFQGFHADHILVIVDEAGGVDEQIFQGVKALTPNINARTLYIGNPTEPSGTFYEAFTNPRIKQFTISAFNSPNLIHVGIKTVEDLIKRMTPPEGVDPLDYEPFKDVIWPMDELISPERVYDRLQEWGADSPAWQALVMGEFPTQAEQSLIPASLVSQAMQMQGVDEDSGKTYAELSGWEIPDGAPEYGQDMARFGSDLNVNYGRRGGWVEKPIIWNKKGDAKSDLMESADRILKIIDPLDFNTRVNIDDTGNGGGTTDRLRQISREQRNTGSPMHQYALAAYNFSSKERMKQPNKFHDITSELYWNLRGWFMRKQIALHYDKDLFNELISRRWGMTPTGKIKVESKDDYKKRTGGRSPDRADALALAFAGGLRQARTIEERFADHEEYVPIRKPYTAGLGNLKYRGW